MARQAPGREPVMELVYAGFLATSDRWHMRRHTHREHHEIIVVMRGGMRVVLGDVTMTARAGDALLYPAGVGHEEWAQPGAPLHTIYIAWRDARVGATHEGPVNVPDRTGRLQWIAEWLLELHQMGRTGTPACSGLLHAMIEAFHTATPEPAVARIERALRYVRDHLQEPLTLDTLAEAASMSRFHFARRFSQHAGCTPMQYVRRARIDAARALMSRSDEPLKVVAQRVGFPDVFRFCKVFRQVVGVSPGQWRRRGDGNQRQISAKP